MPPSSRSELPQVCSRCRKLKVVHLGKFFKSPGRHKRIYFTCDSCLGKPAVQRLSRLNAETPPEREVREALTALGIAAVAEFELGPFTYDLAFKELRLLVELDSRRYHQFKSQLSRDRRKDAYAKAQGWELKRVRIGDELPRRVLEVVNARRGEVL